jgi:hypothetical protein
MALQPGWPQGFGVSVIPLTRVGERQYSMKADFAKGRGQSSCSIRDHTMTAAHQSTSAVDGSNPTFAVGALTAFLHDQRSVRVFKPDGRGPFRLVNAAFSGQTIPTIFLLKVPRT